MNTPWLDSMRREEVVHVAAELGYRRDDHAQAKSAHTVACPACGAVKRHSQSEPEGRKGRGAVGIKKAKPRYWYCWQCEHRGDALDFAAYALCSKRFRDLDADAKTTVRDWCMAYQRVDGPTAPRVRAPEQPPAPPVYPPEYELRVFWDACERVDSNTRVSDYLISRAINPSRVADFDLARALPASIDVPKWARRDGESWSSSSYRLIVSLFDAHGLRRSVLARSIDANASANNKSAAPADCDRAGLIMACGFGRLLLAAAEVPGWWTPDKEICITVCEGEVDFLNVATQWSDAAEFAPATLGITSGSWTPEIAARIPEGSRIVLATDADKQGDAYADRITQTLRGRYLQLERWEPPA